MERWSSHHYLREAADRNIDPSILRSAVAVGKEIVGRNRDIQPVFTLNHLATVCDVEYALLRQYVSRSSDPYRSFRVRKLPGPDGERRHRIICIPSPPLMKVQRWIAVNILAHATVSEASVAYSPGSKLIKAAEPHCRSRWLIKLDISRFFESIPETAVYRVFRSLGFQPLVSFEMARLCTRLYPGPLFNVQKWKGSGKGVWESPYKIQAYNHPWQGHLPQGAPSSPMLANLACRGLDERLSALAMQEQLQYTRYADDLTFSSRDPNFSRVRAAAFVGDVYEQLARDQFSPNKGKTSVVPPGGRKVVLGLLVDGPRPRLTREFKARLRQHIHYLRREDVGPVRHAAARGFTSIVGMRHHILGLIGYAGQVEPSYAAARRAEFESIKWPI